MSEIKIDNILLSIFQRAFRSITDEMSISLTKTTRSPILCEAKDFVTGLLLSNMVKIFSRAM